MRFIFLIALLIAGFAHADDRWIELRKDSDGYTLYADTKSITYGSIWAKIVYNQKRKNVAGKYYDAMTVNFQFDCEGRTGGSVKYFQYLNGTVLDVEGLETPSVYFEPVRPETGTEQFFEVACRIE